MSLTLEEVRHVASLARLSLSAEEEALMRTQLSAILDAVAEAGLSTVVARLRPLAVIKG
jgi:Asp-tRNA(Asn)/Glu-tRNA(Gln) amidotransferase C subunit